MRLLRLLQAHSDPDAALKDFISRQKMGRIGTAEEIAALVLYLASDESNFVTGDFALGLELMNMEQSIWLIIKIAGTEIVVDGGIST